MVRNLTSFGCSHGLYHTERVASSFIAMLVSCLDMHLILSVNLQISKHHFFHTCIIVVGCYVARVPLRRGCFLEAQAIARDRRIAIETRHIQRKRRAVVADCSPYVATLGRTCTARTQTSTYNPLRSIPNQTITIPSTFTEADALAVFRPASIVLLATQTYTPALAIKRDTVKRKRSFRTDRLSILQPGVRRSGVATSCATERH